MKMYSLNIWSVSLLKIYPRREEKPKGEVIFEIRHWNAYDPRRDRQILEGCEYPGQKR